MRKILFIFSCWLGVLSGAFAAETLTLADGGSVAGDIVKTDDNGLQMRLVNDGYTNVPWARFSQDALKQLAQNPKFKDKVDVFIAPDVTQRPVAAEIKIQEVDNRLIRPAHPSLFGGLFTSSVGLFLLLVVYVANLYAAYEVAIFRGRAVGQVVGAAALLPLIGPAVFLAMPMPGEPPTPETTEGEAAAPKPGAAPKAAAGTAEDIQIVEASWRQEAKKPEPQIFARGKYTFNKRFIETKFASYIGELKGDAKKFDMQATTGASGQFAVEWIAQVGANEVIFETKTAQVTVAFSDIMEIKLIPKAE